MEDRDRWLWLIRTFGSFFGVYAFLEFDRQFPYISDLQGLLLPGMLAVMGLLLLALRPRWERTGVSIATGVGLLLIIGALVHMTWQAVTITIPVGAVFYFLSRLANRYGDDRQRFVLQVIMTVAFVVFLSFLLAVPLFVRVLLYLLPPLYKVHHHISAQEMSRTFVPFMLATCALAGVIAAIALVPMRSSPAQRLRNLIFPIVVVFITSVIWKGFLQRNVFSSLSSYGDVAEDSAIRFLSPWVIPSLGLAGAVVTLALVLLFHKGPVAAPNAETTS